MDRRRFLALSAALGLAGPARAQTIPLAAISAYFNGLSTARARFTQTSEDGYRAQGTLYLHRPGRARFEYDPPNEALVMAGGGQLAIFDGKSNETRPEQYPLRRTPLNVILERNVDLTSRDMVVGHSSQGGVTTVIAQDPAREEEGRIELKFQDAPLRLTGWVTVDSIGARTRIDLETLETGIELPARLFIISMEVEARNR